MAKSVDPHWEYGDELPGMRERNDLIYRDAELHGIEFRGYRFWPPFFCFVCGRTISASQWRFSRICGGCDSDVGCLRRRATRDRTFAGKVELNEATAKDLWSIVPRIEEHDGFIDPRTKEGAKLARLAQSVKRLRTPVPPWYSPGGRPPVRRPGSW